MCWPSTGGGAATSGSPPDSLKPERATVSGRSMPGTSSKVLSSPRCAICGSASACGTVSTQPAGTPIRLKTDCHSAHDRFFERRFELEGERGAMALPALALREARVGREVGPADGGDERLELLLLVGGDVDQAVLGPEGARRRGGEVVVAVRTRLDAGDQVVGDGPAHRRQRRVEHRDVDERALAGGVASHQRARDREGGGHAGERVGDREAAAQAARRPACR